MVFLREHLRSVDVSIFRVWVTELQYIIIPDTKCTAISVPCKSFSYCQYLGRESRWHWYGGVRDDELALNQLHTGKLI